MLSEKFGADKIIFRETPADYDFKWHPAPARQLLFIIKGRAEFTVSNGERHVFKAIVPAQCTMKYATQFL